MALLPWASFPFLVWPLIAQAGLFPLLSFCPSLLWQCLALNPEQNCSRTQYEARQKCCTRCPPGQRVRELCTEGSDTVCHPCQPQHFQGSWTKQMVCTPHRYCDQNAGLVVRIQGSATQNTVCQCRLGAHCSSLECHSCRENTACGPGKGVKETATDVTDTVCGECPLGFFSNVSSAVAPCQPWSRYDGGCCAKASCRAMGLAHKANGTRFSDVTCEEARRLHSLALVLLALAAVMGVLAVAGLFLWHRRRLQRKEHPNKPTENEDEEECPVFPTQETQTTSQDGCSSNNCLAREACA